MWIVTDRHGSAAQLWDHRLLPLHLVVWPADTIHFGPAPACRLCTRTYYYMNGLVAI